MAPAAQVRRPVAGGKAGVGGHGRPKLAGEIQRYEGWRLVIVKRGGPAFKIRRSQLDC